MKTTPFIVSFLCLFLFSCNVPDEKNTETINSTNSVKEKNKEQKKVILFFGNSLTAGYGVEASEAFPTLIQKRLDSLGYNYEVINAGVSGETTATGVNRVDWVIEQQDVDIFVLELGANDGLRGVDTNETYRNLKKIIEKVRAMHPEVKIVLAGMMVPPSMGPDYSLNFQKIFPKVATEKNVELVPFLLQDIGGIDSLNQDDGIHPNPAGQKIMAENVWQVLKEHIEK